MLMHIRDNTSKLRAHINLNLVSRKLAFTKGVAPMT